MPVQFVKPLCLKGTERAAPLAGQAGHLPAPGQRTPCVFSVPWASRMEPHKFVSCCPSGHPCCNHKLRSCESGVPPTPPPPPMTRLQPRTSRHRTAEGQTGFAQGISHSCHQHPQGLSQLPQHLQGQSWLPLWRLEVGLSCRGREDGGHLSPLLHPTL